MSCICNQIFSTASMAINNGLPSIGLRLANLLNKHEEKKKNTIENLQKINNNNNSNKGNNNSNKGNNDSNGSKHDRREKEKIKRIKKKIPQRLLDEDGNVKIKELFIIKLKGRVRKKELGGFIIDKDTKKDGGSIWKLKDKNGKRICSLDDNGKILRD